MHISDVARVADVAAGVGRGQETRHRCSLHSDPTRHLVDPLFLRRWRRAPPGPAVGHREGRGAASVRRCQPCWPHGSDVCTALQSVFRSLSRGAVPRSSVLEWSLCVRSVYPSSYQHQISIFDFSMRPGPSPFARPDCTDHNVSACPKGTNPYRRPVLNRRCRCRAISMHPRGRLPIVRDGRVRNRRVRSRCVCGRGRTYRFYTGEPVVPFGYGLSYSSFRYSQLVEVRSELPSAFSLAPVPAVLHCFWP